MTTRPEETISRKADGEADAGTVIRGLLVDFCGRYLTLDATTRIFRLCDRMDAEGACALARGRVEIWAAVIVYIVARTRHLFDADRPDGIAPETIHRFFGTRPDTVTRKARKVSRYLPIDDDDSETEPRDTIAMPSSRQTSSLRLKLLRQAVVFRQCRLFEGTDF